MFAEVGDDIGADFESKGEGLRFFGAVTEELEEVGEAALAFDEAGEAGFEGVEAGEGFFFEESGVGMAGEVVLDEFDGVDEGAVVVDLDGSEIFDVGEDMVFFPMMEASYVTEDEAVEVVEDALEVLG